MTTVFRSNLLDQTYTWKGREEKQGEYDKHLYAPTMAKSGSRQNDSTNSNFLLQNSATQLNVCLINANLISLWMEVIVVRYVEEITSRLA